MEQLEKRCDLHAHSVFSDGSATPRELIAEAKRLGLILALTDHNTVAGLPEFLEAAREFGVTAVPGVELSTDYRGKELHLLGLFVMPEHYRSIEKLVKEQNILKEICNIELVERLNQAGYMIDYANVKRRNPSGNANRAHVAAELVEDDRVEAKKSMLDDYSDLRAMYDENDANTQVLYLKNAVATFSSFTAAPQTYEF